MAKTLQIVGYVESLADALAHIKMGGSLVVMSHTRPLILTPKLFHAGAEMGKPVLSTEGNGYRLRYGKISVFVFATYLRKAR